MRVNAASILACVRQLGMAILSATRDMGSACGSFDLRQQGSSSEAKAWAHNAPERRGSERGHTYLRKCSL